MPKSKQPTWSDVIEIAIIQLGYIATLKQIYEVAIPLKKFNGLTPDKSINERVQKDKRFYKILPGLYALTQHLDKIPLEYQPDDFINKNIDESLDNEKVINTTRIVEQRVRVGQEIFKRNLLKELSFCPITGITDRRLLIGSHIKPWRVSNDKERLDKNNGFIFSPTIDKLFDIGLITFENDKTLLISKSLDKTDVNFIGIKPKIIYEDLPVDNRTHYLEYHRNFIFLD